MFEGDIGAIWLPGRFLLLIHGTGRRSRWAFRRECPRPVREGSGGILIGSRLKHFRSPAISSGGVAVMEPAVQRQGEKASSSGLAEATSSTSKTSIVWDAGLGGGRRDHGHHFVIAGEQRCSDGTQQIPVVDSTQRLGPAVDTRNGHQSAGDLGSPQHPDAGTAPATVVCPRAEKDSAAGCSPPAPLRCRSTVRTPDAGRRSRAHGTTDQNAQPRYAVRPRGAGCEACPGQARAATGQPTGAELYLAPCACCGLRQARSPRRRTAPDPASLPCSPA